MRVDTVKVRVFHHRGLYLMELGLSLQRQQLLLVNLLEALSHAVIQRQRGDRLLLQEPIHRESETLERYSRTVFKYKLLIVDTLNFKPINVFISTKTN